MHYAEVYLYFLERGGDLNYLFLNKTEAIKHNKYDLRRIWLVDETEKYDISQQTLQEDIYIVIRTLAGEGKVSLAGKDFMLKENSLMLTNKRNIIHYKTSSSNWHFYWFEFKCEDIIETQVKTTAINKNELDIINDITYSLSSYDTRLSASGFNYLMAKWDSDSRDSTIDNIALCAAQYIDLSPINTDYSFDFLLEKFCVSERTFRKRFFEAFSMTPREYISKKKLETIKILLKTTRMKIHKISELTGFENEYYFSKHFKLKLGMSPSEYRKNCR